MSIYFEIQIYLSHEQQLKNILNFPLSLPACRGSNRWCVRVALFWVLVGGNLRLGGGGQRRKRSAISGNRSSTGRSVPAQTGKFGVLACAWRQRRRRRQNSRTRHSKQTHNIELITISNKIYVTHDRNAYNIWQKMHTTLDRKSTAETTRDSRWISTWDSDVYAVCVTRQIEK